jgi:imidazolonepropionase-like amidohydrolase
LPPRRDLQLEALVEILQGKRLIHCHSYRLDEILVMLRVAEDFKIRIGTLQHILEGYKVADEIARHGAGASSFADWWGYKVEAWDAIPENAAIMQARGVLTSINSDSADLARRLNTEGAKSMKHGGVSPEEALRFVTLNAAKQLRIDNRVGSLEPGKDADFVIWNGNPLSNYTRVEQTWIDGRKYFDRAEDIEMRKHVAAQREALVQKALGERVKELAKPDGEKKTNGDEAKPGLYGHHHGRYNCRDH